MKGKKLEHYLKKLILVIITNKKLKSLIQIKPGLCISKNIQNLKIKVINIQQKELI